MPESWKGMQLNCRMLPYPLLTEDVDLFDYPEEKQQIMADYGLTEQEARDARAIGLV